MNGILYDQSQGPLPAPSPNVPSPMPHPSVPNPVVQPGTASISLDAYQPGSQKKQNQGWRPQQAQDYLNTGYLDQMRALAAGGSQPWLRGRMEQERIRQAGDVDALQRQGMSSLATQQGQMAMRGGLTSGASERLGSQNLMGMLQGRSDLSRSAAAREAGLQSEADQRQRDLLGMLGQHEMGAANYRSGIDQFNAQQANQDYAARQMAQAMRNQPTGGGGLFGGGGILGLGFGG